MRRAVDQPPCFDICCQNEKQLTDLDFTDDIALTADNEQVCQVEMYQIQDFQIGIHAGYNT